MMERMADAPTDSKTTEPLLTETQPSLTSNRSTLPQTPEFRSYISSQWAEHPDLPPSPRAAAPLAAARRQRISALHPGKRLIVPAGPAQVRSNDTDYPYRAHSAFSYLTGWGSDAVPDSVLVLEPTGSGHTATLYFLAAAGRDTTEFYANAGIGEFWTGPRPSLAHVAADLELETLDLAEFDAVLESMDAATLVVRDADSGLTDQIDGRRLLSSDGDSMVEVDEAADTALARDLSELRFVKDDWELDELRAAIAATKRGFDEIIADLPAAIATERGERVIEGTFNRQARIDGNTVGYDTIAASGPHACYLHWTRNDGPVVPGDLLLIDAGVELDSLYTADITRTLPVSGTFTDIQRQIYDAVLEAADAARAVVKPGIRFREIHAEAMRVIAEKTAEWGLLPGSAQESLDTDAQWHRRYMIHGTSHHLGLDVHDCAKARRELYLDGVLEEGMVFTIEPGLYFQADDLTVPEHYRGIGVRIEDNIAVTADGCELMSGDIPRTADDVERWMSRLTS
jgi:Xaa-Pro aminopeptidase